MKNYQVVVENNDMVNSIAVFTVQADTKESAKSVIQKTINPSAKIIKIVIKRMDSFKLIEDTLSKREWARFRRENR